MTLKAKQLSGSRHTHEEASRGKLTTLAPELFEALKGLLKAAETLSPHDVTAEFDKAQRVAETVLVKLKASADD